MEKKIRFATAILNFSRAKGGAERYLIDLCTRMAQEDFEVHVYAVNWDDGVPGIHFHKVKTIPFFKSLRLLSFSIRATNAIVKSHYDVTLGVGNSLRADVLQPHGGVHWAWFWRSLKAYNDPILWTIKFLGRILSPRQWVSGYIEDAPYKHHTFSKIVAISEMVKKDIMHWYRIPEEQIIVVYNGVDTDRFHPRNYQYREEIRKRHGIGNEKMILFVSNNFRMKGLGFLMKALVQIKEEGHFLFKLLILGRDHPRSYLRLAKKLELAEKVIFAGSTNEPEKYYGAADLLVHPTFYDACSLTVLEALASGLPAITTLSNGASGVMSRNEGGRVIRDPKNLGELKEGIQYYLGKEIRGHALHPKEEGIEDYSDRVNFNRMMGIFRGMARDSS